MSKSINVAGMSAWVGHLFNGDPLDEKEKETFEKWVEFNDLKNARAVDIDDNSFFTWNLFAHIPHESLRNMGGTLRYYTFMK